MDVLVASRGIRRRVCLDMAPDAGLTGRDLARAAGLQLGERLWIDGVGYDPDSVLDELPLRIGCEIRADETSAAVVNAASNPSRPCWATQRSGLAAFHRSPRTVVAASAPLSVPERAIPADTRAPFGWSAVVIPLLIAVPLVLLLGPRFAIFAALGPVLTVGSWFEAKRRARRAVRDADAQNLAAAAGLCAAVDRRQGELVARRREGVRSGKQLVGLAADAGSETWNRSTDHSDFGVVTLGDGVVAWAPECATASNDWSELEPSLFDSPVEVSFGAGHIVGIVGHAETAAGVARSLITQLSVGHAPSDLGLRIHVAAGRRPAWDWCGWLPHCATSPAARLEVALIEGAAQLQGRAAVARVSLAAGAGSAIIVVDDEDQLPATVGMILRVRSSGVASVSCRGREFPDGALPVAVTQLCTITEAEALDVARGLAHLDDPDLPRPDAGLPNSVSLPIAMGIDPGSSTAAAVRGQRDRWSEAPRGSLHIVLGADEHGPLVIDLVGDGPHCLIGGTTGSGKSELLRSMVCSMAVGYDPRTLNIVLIDYKGGSAFDACAGLPHVVGIVTDLDDGMAARALRCLRAELHVREVALRDVGADSIDADAAVAAGLPRLVVIIDEFATLAADLPEFLDALIGIAQRGRSLGVHLVLATQRPGGSIRADIRANTSIRIALRVADAGDSTDIIDQPDAAAIDRALPGRAIARLGPGDTMRFQSALVTGATSAHRRAGVVVSPVLRTKPQHREQSDRRDIDRIVEVARAAWVGPVPRTPWPPPLPERPPLLDDGSCGLVDRPDEQRIEPLVMENPAGSVAVFGGDYRPLLAVLGPWLQRSNQVHIQVVADHGLRVALDGIEAVGSLVSVGEERRVQRLLRYVVDEIERRTMRDQSTPLVLVIEDLDALVRADGRDHLEVLERVATVGSAVGVGLVLGGAGAVTGAARLRSLLDADFAVTDGLQATDRHGVDVVFASVSSLELDRARPPATVPYEVRPQLAEPTIAQLLDTGDAGDGLIVGQSLLSLEPAFLYVGAGAQAMILGPAASGRTTLLRLLAQQLVDTARVVAVGFDPEHRGVVAADHGDLAGVLHASSPDTYVLVDDAVRIDDAGGQIQAARVRRDRPAVIAAARTDALRSAFGHWSLDLRAARTGVILRPDVLDPELLSAVGRLDPEVRAAGRGVVINDGVMDDVTLLVS